MKKIWKKLLAVTLALSMTMSMVSVTSLAAEEENEETSTPTTTYCRKEAHKHSKDCYEGDGWTAEQVEGKESDYVFDKDANLYYVKRICGKEKHTHTDPCYVNITVSGGVATIEGDGAHYFYVPTTLNSDQLALISSAETVVIRNFTVVYGFSKNESFNAVKNLTIENVGTIVASAFLYNSTLKTVRLIQVGTIDTNAFYGNSALETVCLDQVGTIGAQAFCASQNVKEVTVEGAEQIGNFAFYGLTNLEAARISDVGKLGHQILTNSGVSTNSTIIFERIGQSEEDSLASVGGTNTIITLDVVLTLDANGGTGSMETVRGVGNIAGAATLTLPENEFKAPKGKRFAGWNTKPDGTGTSYKPGGTYKQTVVGILSMNVAKLYAQWTDKTEATVKVIYKANNGTNETSVYEVTVGIGETATYPTPEICEFTSPEGKRFLEWRDVETGFLYFGGEHKINNVDDDITVTLEARWEDSNEVCTCTTYCSGTGSDPTTTEENKDCPVCSKHRSWCEAHIIKVPVEIYVTFDAEGLNNVRPGWNEIPENFSMPFKYIYTSEDGEVTGELIGVAAWDETQTSENAPRMKWSLTVPVERGEGKSTTIDFKLKNYEINGYSFVYTNSTGEAGVEDGSASAVILNTGSGHYGYETNKHYFTNLYKIMHTVTYTDGVEDSEVFADRSYAVAVNDSTPAFEGTPTREGYTFTGWSPAVAETVTDNVTYVAQWNRNSVPPTFYTLTINYVDGEGNVVADRYTTRQASGYRYSVNSPAVEGMTPDQATVSGILTGNTTITVTYAEDVDEPDTPTTESPEPTESPEVTETPAPTESPEESEDLNENDTPLVETPETSEPPVEPTETPDEGEDLGDNDTPLADVPQTGDFLWLWLTLALLSAAGLVWASLTEKKGKRVSK